MEELERMRGKAEDAERKVERLSEQIMKALASTIDAKDKYTNGHSFRVAEYSEEMLRRAGGSVKEQEEIYYMGLLHDIGKIGIPDAVGARWHHEKYDGSGYPDGLAGEKIPVMARIIAVADAYDAMASRRSYRDVLPQQVVRSELEKGKGKQFDPYYADIMIGMIDDDKEYQMREV